MSIFKSWFGDKQAEEDQAEMNVPPKAKTQLPMENIEKTHGSALNQSLQFLRHIIQARLNHHFGKTDTFVQPEYSFVDDGSVFAHLVIDHKLNVEEFILLLLALAPHTHPDLFSDLIKNHLPKGGDFPEFGRVRGQNYRGIMPTGETVLFVPRVCV